MFEILLVSIQWIMVLLSCALIYYVITRFILKYHSLNSYQKREIIKDAKILTSNRRKSYRQKLLGFTPWRKGLEIYF